MDDFTGQARRFSSNEGLDGFIHDVDELFLGEFAMIAARDDMAGSFYEHLCPMALMVATRNAERPIILRLENNYGVVKKRFIIGSFAFDECRRLALEHGRETFLYAAENAPPCEYDSQTGQAVFKADFRRTMAHWLLPSKDNGTFTVSKLSELDSSAWRAMKDADECGHAWTPLFEISHRRLPRKGPRVICIDDRFVWHADDYPGWRELVSPGACACLIPYRGWTPELLLGDGTRYFELWKNVHPGELLQPGELCICGPDVGVSRSEGSEKPTPESTEPGDMFRVCQKGTVAPFALETLQDGMSLGDACTFILRRQGVDSSFVPTMVCTKGRGILKALIDDPQSTFIVASCWRAGRKAGDRFIPIDASDNTFRKPPVLDLFGHLDESSKLGKVRLRRLAELREKCHFSTLLLRCGGRCIVSVVPPEHNPCWNYTLADYTADGVCFVLKPGYSQEGLEALKETVMDRLASLDIEAIFVKEKEKCYALGCRSEELALEYLGSATIHFPKNRGERLPLPLPEGFQFSLAEKVRMSLFIFLKKLYNHAAFALSEDFGFSKVDHLDAKLHSFIKVPYIEEEIYRSDIPRECFGMAGVMAYRHGRQPVRRSQWERIE